MYFLILSLCMYREYKHSKSPAKVSVGEYFLAVLHAVIMHGIS